MAACIGTTSKTIRSLGCCCSWEMTALSFEAVRRPARIQRRINSARSGSSGAVFFTAYLESLEHTEPQERRWQHSGRNGCRHSSNHSRGKQVQNQTRTKCRNCRLCRFPPHKIFNPLQRLMESEFCGVRWRLRIHDCLSVFHLAVVASHILRDPWAEYALGSPSCHLIWTAVPAHSA